MRPALDAEDVRRRTNCITGSALGWRTAHLRAEAELRCERDSCPGESYEYLLLYCSRQRLWQCLPITLPNAVPAL